VDDVARRRVAGASWVVGMAAVLAVIAPLSMLSVRADERYKYFVHGPDWVANPAGIPVYVFSEIDNYIAQGNFRPLGRIIEHTNFLLVELVMQVLSVPLPVALGMQRAVSALLLAAALAFLVGAVIRVSGSASQHVAVPRVLVLTVFAGVLVAYGTGSALNTFSGMYLQSAAIVVACIALVLRDSLWRPRRVRTIEWVSYGAAGALLASINEIGYLAVPAIAAVVVLQILARIPAPFAAVIRLPGVGLSAVAAVGFLVVFIPVRLAIQAACDAADGGCYRASAISLDAWSLRFWATRATAGLPVRAWGNTSDPGVDLWWIAAGGAVLAVAIAVVLWRSRALAEHSSTVPCDSTGAASSEGPVVRRAWMLDRDVTFAAIGAALVVSAALLSSLSEELQASQSGEGWREAPVAMAGWAILVTAIIAFVLRVTPASRLASAAAGTLASLLVVAAVVTNIQAREAELADEGFAAGDRIALELAAFRADDESIAVRCALLDDLSSASSVRPADAQLITDVVQDYALHHHAEPFCPTREGAE